MEAAVARLIALRANVMKSIEKRQETIEVLEPFNVTRFQRLGLL
jgi:hypothetical protein